MDTTRRRFASMSCCLASRPTCSTRPRRRFSRRSSSRPSSSALVKLSSAAATPASIFMARSISSAAREQRHLADLLQVHAHRVAGEHGDVGGLVALAHRAAGLLRAHLGQRHIGSGLELLLGDALEQVLLLTVLVDVGLRLLVGCRLGAAHIGLDVVDVEHVLVLKHLFDHRGGSGRLRGFRGLGSGCLVLRSLSHVFFLSTG